jgi:hypothetical protein
MKPFRPALGAFALAALFAAGCQREKPREIYELTGRLFVFNYRLSYATYMLTFRRVSPVADGTVAHAEFENPAGGAPLLLDQKVFPAQEKLVIESPDISCVKKNWPYKVTVRFSGPDGDIQTIEATVTSDLDQSVLAAKPLVTGPAYDKNPDVFKEGGKADFSGNKDCAEG